MHRLDYTIIFIFTFTVGFIIEAYLTQITFLLQNIALYSSLNTLWFTPLRMVYIMIFALFILLIARFRKPRAKKKQDSKIRLRKNKFLKGYALDYDEDGLEWLRRNLGGS